MSREKDTGGKLMFGLIVFVVLIPVMLIAERCNGQDYKSVVFMSTSNAFLENSNLNPGLQMSFCAPFKNKLYAGVLIGVTHLRKLQSVYFPVAANIKIAPVEGNIRPFVDAAAGYGIRNKKLSSYLKGSGGFWGSASGGIIVEKVSMVISLGYVNYGVSTKVLGTAGESIHQGGLLLNIGVKM